MSMERTSLQQFIQHCATIYRTFLPHQRSQPSRGRTMKQCISDARPKKHAQKNDKNNKITRNQGSYKAKQELPKERHNGKSKNETRSLNSFCAENGQELFSAAFFCQSRQRK